MITRGHWKLHYSTERVRIPVSLERCGEKAK